MKAFLPSLLLLAACMNTTQAHPPHTPPPGSEERKQILQEAHAPAEQALGQPLSFVVNTLNVSGDWAFLYARMQTAGGAPVNYIGTKFAEAASQGGQSDVYAALLHRTDGHWKVVESSVGPTDPVWLTWEGHGAPHTLFAIDD